MITDQSGVFVDPYEAGEYDTFRQYLDQQTENLPFFLGDYAEARWARLREEGASEEAVGEAQALWWEQQERRLRSRLRRENGREDPEKLKRKLQQEKCGRIQAEDQLQASQAENQMKDELIQRLMDELQVERAVSAQWKERWRCLDCNQPTSP